MVWDPSHAFTQADIMGKPLPELHWLVQSLIAEQERVIFYGEFGSFKSWLLLDLAVSIAAGEPWLGAFHTEPKRVLYIDEEMSERTLRRRAKRLGLARPTTPTDLPITYLSGSNFRATADIVAQLQAWLVKAPAEVIIIEALRRVLVGQEVAQQDVSLFWQRLMPLRTEGRAIVVSHHMRKPSFEGGEADHVRYRASGTTDIIAGCDVALAVERQNETDIRVECVKSREAEIADPFVVKFETAINQDAPVRLTYLPLNLQECIRAESAVMRLLEGSLMPFVARTDILNALLPTGYSIRTLDRALATLREQGKLIIPIRGRLMLPRTPTISSG